MYVFFFQDEDQPPEKEAPETQDTASSSCRQQKFLPTPQTCRGIKRKIDDDGKKEEAAFGFLEVAAKSLSEKDDCSIFEEMIATQLRKLTPRNQAIARNRIQNLIFDFEMQEINNSLQNNTVAPQYYSPSSDSSYGTHYEPNISSQLQISTEKSQHPSNVLGEVQHASIIAFKTPGIIDEINGLDTLNRYTKDANKSPVAKYLTHIASLISGGTASLKARCSRGGLSTNNELCMRKQKCGCFMPSFMDLVERRFLKAGMRQSGMLSWYLQMIVVRPVENLNPVEHQSMDITRTDDGGPEIQISIIDVIVLEGSFTTVVTPDMVQEHKEICFKMGDEESGSLRERRPIVPDNSIKQLVVPSIIATTNGDLIVEGIIENRKVPLLVDTGAVLSLLKEGVSSQPLFPEYDKVTIRGVTESPLEILGILKMAINSSENRNTVWGILGLDILRQLGAIINLRKNYIHSEGDSEGEESSSEGEGVAKLNPVEEVLWQYVLPENLVVDPASEVRFRAILKAFTNTRGLTPPDMIYPHRVDLDTSAMHGAHVISKVFKEPGVKGTCQ
ncbi:hypothetical protein J6590_087271 [Homalodisca vitripennis]|nr:hypothetical protein J6590_087271 [Homalodisca vitripennis]